MSEETYLCSGCGGEFTKMRTDEEALAASREIWGPVAEQDLALLCDDCFKEMMEWRAKNVRDN